jgi:hypothetical protein
MTPTQRRSVTMVKRLARLMKRDAPNEWPGLRDAFGRAPSRLGASLFFLGSAIDGGRQPADVAWRSAQRFVLGIVPLHARDEVWSWILRTHTLTTWRRRRRAYGLHRIGAWHDRVYRFARFIIDNLNGDPRNIWRRIPEDVDPIDHLRSVLYTMRFGPALTRMVVGALVDHGLVKGDTAFKDDIHVRRGMKALGLSRSQNSRDVLEAGLRFFGRHSWKVDLVLYRLGERGYKSRAAIERYYRERLIERRDDKVRAQWKQQQERLRKIVRAAMANARKRARLSGWRFEVADDGDSIGFLMSRRRGIGATDFVRNSLEVWVGLSVNIGEATIAAWTQFDFDIESRVARSEALRDALQHERYKCSYFDADGWEMHCRRLLGIPMARASSVSDRRWINAITRGASEVEAILIFGAR